MGTTRTGLWSGAVQPAQQTLHGPRVLSIPRSLRVGGADMLYSSANFGPLRCPCRQVILVRNPIYFDGTFMRRIRAPKVQLYYRFQRWLTLRCMAASDVVLFPTRAMLDLVA